MIQRALSFLTVTSLVLSSSVCQADQPVKLRFRMQKDNRLIYRTTTKVRKTETVMGRKVKTELDSNSINIRTLNKIDDKGRIHLETAIERIKMTAKIGPLGEYKYDSTSSDNEKASMLGNWFTPVFDTLNGASFKVTITPQGDVLPMKGYKELLAEVVKDNPMKDNYSNEAFQVEFGETLVRLPKKPVKEGDSWEHKFERKIPGVGTLKGTSSFKHAGTVKIGSRKTVKIIATYEGSLEIDLSRNGAKITGTLTTSEASGVIHFDPETGTLVSKTKTGRLKGTMNADVNGMNIAIENDQTNTVKIELLKKLPN